MSVLCSANNKILDPQLYNVWTIEQLDLRYMIIEEIEHFANVNPEDSLQNININDKIIVIVSKKDKDVIYELRYGNSGKYHSIDKKQINWVLPEKLRREIIEKYYYYVSDDSYIRNVKNSREQEYFSNQFYWTNSDIYLSSGSKLIVDRFIYRFTTIGGIPIRPSNAFSIRSGNELLGYPGDSKGMMDWGLLSPYYELGIQTPIFELVGDNPFHIISEEENSNSYLQGGLGGYGKVLLNPLQVQLAFADMDENILVKDNIKDSAFVDYLSLSVFASSDLNFQKPILKLGHLKGMIGLGYYEISHKSLNNDNHFVDRLQKKNGELYESSKTNYFGVMIRGDFITLVKKNGYPLLHLYFQLNGYEGNKSWQTGIGINIKKIGADLTYKHSIDDVDWAPTDEVLLSINYSP